MHETTATLPTRWVKTLFELAGAVFMKRIALSMVVAVASSALICSSALAQQACDKPALIAYADYLLTGPQETGNFARDYQSASAAYLKIVFTPEAYDGARSLIDALLGRPKPPERIDELNLAQLNRDDRRAKVMAVAGVKGPLSDLQYLGDSVLRSLLLNDTDWFIGELAKADQAGALPQGGQHWPRLAQSVIDSGDTTLGELARKAEAAELWSLSFLLDAGKTNFVDVVALLDRAPPVFFQPEAPGAEAKANRLDWAIANAMWRFAAFDPAQQPPGVQTILSQKPHRLMMLKMAQLIAKAPQAKLLPSIYNYTGNMGMSLIADTLLTYVEKGTLDPLKDPDAFDQRMIQEIDKAIGPKMRNEQVAQIKGMDAYFTNAAVRSLLSPLLADASKPLPEKPDWISPEVDWGAWTRVADDLRQKKPIAAADKVSAVYLLAGAGRHSDALAELAGAENIKQARVAADRQMQRLDDLCGNAFRPATLDGEPLFRFDKG